MERITKVDAIASLLPNGGWSMADDEVIFDNSDAPSNPSEKQINDELDRLEAKFAAELYRRKRSEAYAKLNQDEMRFDDLINGTNTWRDAILAIKAEYPKEVSP